MKNFIFAFLMLIAFANVSLGQNKAKALKNPPTKVIVMVNTATWCPACQANGKRVEQEVISSYMNNSKCQIIVNDLSDEKSKSISKENCSKAGISDVASSNKATGMLYFIHSDTKKIIGQISVIKTNEEIKAALEKALSTI